MRGLAIIQLAFLAAWKCRAQIYAFEDTPIPVNRTLHTLYAFYVYSLAESPDTAIGPPFVKFSDLRATPTISDGVDHSSYQGVQVSIMRFRDFWTLINPNKFCSTESDVQMGTADAVDTLLVQKHASKTFADVDVYLHTIRFPSLTESKTGDTMRKNISSTGVYILVFSNCGKFVDATVAGNVIVKNAYGFLPGIEYHKMPFYGWMMLIYGVLAFVWLGLSIRWWKELFNIQMSIGAVIFFGLVESFLWYMHFHDWNETGKRGKTLFILAIWFTVVKSCFSYMLVLVASLGWGVTRPFLDRDVITKVQTISFLYIVLDFIREAVLSFRHSHTLSLVFVLLCLLPVSLMNGGLFYWVFTALSGLIQTLEERKQTSKLKLFQRLWKILVFVLIVASLALLFQFFDLTRSSTTRWKYQWLFADGVSHFLFLFVLVAMMYLWAPHKYSMRYAYTTQVAEDEEHASDNPAAVWADDDGDDADGDDADSFWAATKKDGADAEVIGLSKAKHKSSDDA